MSSSANAASYAAQSVVTGTFTSAATAAAETITLGFDPEWMLFIIDNNGTNPNLVLSFNGGTDSILVTGTTGVITSPTNVVTYSGDGTVILASTAQVNSGVNYWVAGRQ